MLKDGSSASNCGLVLPISVILLHAEYTFVKSSLVNKPSLRYPDLSVPYWDLIGTMTNISTIHLKIGLLLASMLIFCFNIVDVKPAIKKVTLLLLLSNDKNHIVE